MRERLRNPVTTLAMVGALLFLFLPLAIVVLFSFNDTGRLTFPFGSFTLDWYRQVLSSREFRSAAANSARVAAVISATTLVMGTLAAYGLTRTRSRLRPAVALLLFLPLTIPGLFLGLSLLSVFARSQVSLSLTTVAVAHLVYVLPYYLLIGVAALERLDPALEEAGADLGANAWLVFWRVTVPQVWPVLMAAALLAFVLSFDEFIITFFVIGPQSTLPLFIFSSLRRTVSPAINAISTVLLMITLVLFAVSFLLTLRTTRTSSIEVDPMAPDTQ